MIDSIREVRGGTMFVSDMIGETALFVISCFFVGIGVGALLRASVLATVKVSARMKARIPAVQGLMAPEAEEMTVQK